MKRHSLQGNDGAIAIEHDEGLWVIGTVQGGYAALTPEEAHELYLILTNKFAQVGSDA